MQVQEIMTRTVEVLHPDQSIQEAAERMKELDVGPLPVCEDNRLVGMITDRDIALAAELALPHRIRRGPFQQGEITPDQLMERIEQLQSQTSSGDKSEPQMEDGEQETQEKKS